MEYLRYILTPDGLLMDKTKVQTIVDWPESHKVKDIQSFLGFTNFYHRFIHGYSNIVIPLTHLTRKNSLWKFDSKCCAAFKKLKEEFTHAPVLTHWVPDAKIVVETDALDYALAAILSAYTPDGELHPIAFHSHSFNPMELNYDTHDKELLAIFKAFKHWCNIWKVVELWSMLSLTTKRLLITRNYSQSSKHSSIGANIWKVAELWSMLSLTTKIWNIS